MTDSEFQQTKRILLEQERMNREYTQLANYIQERLSVQVINVTCTKREDSINLTLWFKYENEANSFYKERFVVDSRKRNAILKQFKQIAYLQPIITQYFIDNKSEIWLLFLIAHSKR